MQVMKTKVVQIQLGGLALIGMAAMIMAACNDSEFKGNVGRKAAEEAPAEPAKILPVNLTCLDSDANASTKSISVKGKRHDKIKIQGEFCPRAYANLTVLFVIDVSGSMGDNDNGNAFSGCGRSASVKAITDRLIANARPQDQINAGAITFSTTAAQVAPLQPVAQFQANVSHGTLCNVQHTTNYGAALNSATQMLANVSGTKVVYFITDGRPEIYRGAPDTQAENEGLVAAQQLRAQADTTLNAIYLGNPDQTALNYLAQIAGDANRVRLVSNAAQMAEEILKFALPEIVVVENTVRGSLRIESSTDEQAVSIKTFQRISNRTGVWSYETEPFLLNIDALGRSLHHFTIKANDQGGKEQSASVTIDFQALD